MTQLIIKTAGLTDRGQMRSNNEDAVCVEADLGLLIVADGMGGHQSGEKASAIAVSSIPATLKRLTPGNDTPDTSGAPISDETNRLGFSIKMANRMIFDAASSDPRDSGMGTTCT